MIHLPYDIRTNIVWADMQTADTLMDSVASGRKPMQLICSLSGFGKTAKAKKRFAQYGIVSEQELYRSLPPLPEISAASLPGLPAHMLKSMPQTRRTAMRRAVQNMPPFENAAKRLYIETRPTQAISLVRTLYLCTMLRASALLFDDPGRLASDEASCDVLKTGFGFQRTVTFESPEITRNENHRISGHGAYDPFIPPPDFPVPDDLRWLWLANVNYASPAVLAKLGDHFAPLIARGLDPFWMRDDAEHDHRDLFLCVHYMATEENLLRSMGFPYEVSRRAVNFFITHPDRLVDLCPRRLELLARAFATDQPAAALEAQLTAMAPSVIRPKLRLPASWITVPDGVLRWPEQPFSKVKPPVEGQPPRRIRRREREYKRLHEPNQFESRTPATPDPDPEPPPPVATQPVQPDPDPEPDPDPPPSIPDPDPMPTLRPGERGQSPFDAIDAVYALPPERTCDMVADVLQQFPVDDWDEDQLNILAEGLAQSCDWNRCGEGLAESYFMVDQSLKLFADDEGVLQYEDDLGLQIHSWDSVRRRMAPHIAEQAKQAEERRREQEGRAIVNKKLPKVRKLKAMRALIDQLLALNRTIGEDGQRAIEYIRAMLGDDPKFAECRTFTDYIRKAIEITPPTGFVLVGDVVAVRRTPRRRKPLPQLAYTVSEPPPTVRQPVVTGAASKASEPAPKTLGPAEASDAGMEAPADPSDGWEKLDENGCVEHFGIPYTAPPHLVPRVLAVRSILEEKVGTRDIGAWIKAGYAKSLINQTLFNIAKIREVVDDAKAQVTQAEADGFKIAEPTEYGAQNHGEAHNLMLRAFGLQHVVNSLKLLVEGGYLRIIGGMRLYQIERMSELMERGRAMQKPLSIQR